MRFNAPWNYKSPLPTSHHLQQSKVLRRFDRSQSDNLTNKHLLEPPFFKIATSKISADEKISQNSSKYKANRANVDKTKKLLHVDFLKPFYSEHEVTGNNYRTKNHLMRRIPNLSSTLF